MAKELAQTMGGKKIGLLIAILATFAVLATMGNQLVSKSASANITSGPSLNCTAGPWTGGDAISCTVTSSTDQAGDFTVTTTVPSTSPEAASTCDTADDGVEGLGANSLTCLYDGPASTNSNYVATVDAQENCSSDLYVTATANAADSDSDTGSDTEQRTIETPCLDVDKMVYIPGGFGPNICELPCAGVYVFQIDNSGSVDATGVGFVDELDDRLFVTSIVETETPGTCTVDNDSPNGPVVTCSGFDVPANGSIYIEVLFTMSTSDIPLGQPLGDRVENSLAYDGVGTCVEADNVAPADAENPELSSLCDSSMPDDDQEGSLFDDATFFFTGEIAASLEKHASATSVSSNSSEAFTWILQIRNTGSVPMTGITLTDGQLNGGEVGSVTADTQSFTGSLDGACVVTAGEPGVLECDFDNGSGSGDSSPITQLNHGESIFVTVLMHTVEGADEVTITNTAELDWVENTGEPVTSTGTVNIDNDAVLSITKTVDGPTVGGAGSNDPGQFIITIHNSGLVAGTGLDLTDVIPAGLTVLSLAGDCVSGGGNSVELNTTTIAAGDTLVCTVNVQLAAGIVSPLTSFLNTARLTADLGVDISASAAIQASVPDLSIVKESSGQVSASENVTFTITVTNDGNSDASSVNITDTLPAGLSLVSIVCPANSATVSGFSASGDDCLNGTIGEGATAIVTITASLNNYTIDDDTILVNVAAVTAANTTGAMDSANTVVNAPALTVVKTNVPTLIGQDGIVTSTIVVTNSGSEPLTDIYVYDYLPEGTSYVATGSSAACEYLGGGEVYCESTVSPIAVGASVTFVIRFNVNDTEGEITNVVYADGYIDGVYAVSASAEASVDVVEAAEGGLVHVDVDAAAETAAHNGWIWDYCAEGESDSCQIVDPYQVLHDPGNSEDQKFLQDDDDDATGSMHTVCLISDELGTNEQGQIVWNILPTPGSNATVSPAGGTKSVMPIDDDWHSDEEANCVSWRSAGTGGQTITATDTLTGTVYYLYGTEDSPVIKEWNDIDSTKIVAALGNVGWPTLYWNTQDLASWTSFTTTGAGTTASPYKATSTCVRDQDVPVPTSWLGTVRDFTGKRCADRTNVDGTTVDITGSSILVGNNAGNIIAGNASFIEYAFGDHPEYAGPIDGVKQTFRVTGTCGSVRVENPVTGATAVIYPTSDTDANNSTNSVTILNSDKGVGFQITPTDDGSVKTTTANADCSPNEITKVTIKSIEDVQLRSDIDDAPAETITVRWVVAPPPQKQILLAWAGQRVILEHDWRINGAGAAYDVSEDVINPNPDRKNDRIPALPAAGNYCVLDDDFTVQYIRGSGPGNFLPSLDVEIIGNDNAWVYVDYDVDQWYDDNDIEDGNENCISRVLYESEDQGQVDIEAFIAYENGINQTKIAFVIYYMKFESIELSIVDSQSKPNHNAPSMTVKSVAPYEWGDYAPGNPWDASGDSVEAEWNVSADLLLRGRIKGWFTNSNPSGRLYDNSNPLNVLPADRWVMPDDWELLAGGPKGEEVYGTAEEFRPGYDRMIAPNNVGPLNDGNTTPFLCDTPWGGCSETLTALFAQTYDIVGPVEGPYSLLDIVGPLSAALSNYDPTVARNTIVRDYDVDWWDAPMPAAPVSIDLRESGFLKQVLKENVYWTGTVNGHYGAPSAGGQDYTNPFYMINVPDSAFIPATAAGGGFLWDSFGPDGVGGLGQGVYKFWTALPQFLGYGLPAADPRSASVSMGYVADPTLTTALRTELAQIRVAYGSGSTDAIIAAEAKSIGRALVVFTDNHGEFMVQANGDFNLTYADCDDNIFGGGMHCAEDDLVGTSLITSTVDYPDFRGKHFPIKSNSVSVDWTWGGYKEVTIEDGETDQFKYIVFRALDRDGFCSQTLPGSVSLHPVLSSWDAKYTVGANDPVEYVDFLIDAGEGIIVSSNGGTINDGKQFATGVPTFSTKLNTTIKEFAPLNGGADECQAWIRVSNSLLGILNVMTTAYDDEGDIGFDRIIDFSSTASYELTFRWSLITWAGQDNISVTNALKGTVGDGANDIFDEVTAVYGWNQASQSWLGFFPAGVSVPGANDLTALRTGQAYWIAIKGPDSVTWTIGTDVN